MKSTPRTGLDHEMAFTVEPKHTIDFAANEMPAVLSTPTLVGWLERTARETLAPFLEPGESSVGTEIELRHLAPTPLGQTVRCRARIATAEGPSFAFHVEAFDQQELIARGFHRRRVVRAEAFARRVAAKAKG